jgi:hypothetical protein
VIHDGAHTSVRGSVLRRSRRGPAAVVGQMTSEFAVTWHPWADGPVPAARSGPTHPARSLTRPSGRLPSPRSPSRVRPLRGLRGCATSDACHALRRVREGSEVRSSMPSPSRAAAGRGVGAGGSPSWGGRSLVLCHRVCVAPPAVRDGRDGPGNRSTARPSQGSLALAAPSCRRWSSDIPSRGEWGQRESASGPPSATRPCRARARGITTRSCAEAMELAT